ncbi:GlxA family transcriptional regulator [Pseudonocardia xinjiangensis]|uniref:GlxA family transcriptional regulator n=1 Tax=Pseudonocardia xinjiangensis TaxID=75289 RepID=UPI003D8C684A
MAPHRVGILVFDGVTMLDVSGPAEVLGKACQFGSSYEVVLLSPRGGDVQTSAGLRLGPTTAAHEVGALDTAIIAGGDRLPVQVIEEELLAAARLVVSAAGRVASVCTGAFVLAALGELDGRRATTHWRHAERLERRYPKVLVEPDAIFVADGEVVTSAGVSAGIDLALALVEHDEGAEVARQVAQELVVFLQRPGGQSQFSVATTTPVPRSAPIRALLATVVAAPDGDHSLTAMAAAIPTSTRHLARLFQDEVGTTPARWVERTRLEAAQRLLLEGHSITAAARRSGLGSDESLRRAFGRHLGITPTEYRQRFASTRRQPSRP